MAKASLDPITDDHYTAFGMIVHIVAEIDGLLDQIIITMVRGELTILPLLTFVGTKDKMGYIVAIAKESNLSPIAINGLEGLIKRAGKVHSLRNQIAHGGWIAGQRPGTIKPMTIYARETLKLLGIEHNEKQWTADELKAEATRYKRVGTDLATFMKRYGLIPRSR
jgi:hypothetical protein